MRAHTHRHTQTYFSVMLWVIFTAAWREEAREGETDEWMDWKRRLDLVSGYTSVKL